MKRTTVFQILTVLYVALVAVLCFANLSSPSDVPKTILGVETDKLVHFAMFFPFPILAFLSFRTNGMGLGATLGLIVLIFAVGCLLAGATEYIQGLLPYRNKDTFDLKADMLGMILSSVIVFTVSCFAHARRKS